MVGKPQKLNTNDHLYEAILPEEKHFSLFFKLKNIIQKNIIAIGIVSLLFAMLSFGGIYLFKLNSQNAVFISGVKQVNNSEKEVSSKNPQDVQSYNKREVIGFLPSWMVAQNAQVNTSSLTQLIYFGLGVNDNGDLIQYSEEKKPTLEWHYFNSPHFTNTRNEALENKTKVLIAFKMFDNENIDNLISNSVATNRFIKNVLNIVDKYNLDGVNIDFEYFTDSDFPTAKFLHTFLKNLSQALKKSNPSYILSIDINAIAMLSDRAYDMARIGEIVDQVIVMAYDYKTMSSVVAGPVAPLLGDDNEHSIRRSINSLVGKVPMAKIVLGIPFYGYEWQTVNKKFKSQVVDNSGALATYKRIQELLKTRSDIIKHWDQKSMSPWFTYTQNGVIKQIYYEDEKSLVAKLDFVKSYSLGGIAVWAIGYEGKYNGLWNIITSRLQ